MFSVQLPVFPSILPENPDLHLQEYDPIISVQSVFSTHGFAAHSLMSVQPFCPICVPAGHSQTSFERLSVRHWLPKEQDDDTTSETSSPLEQIVYELFTI